MDFSTTKGAACARRVLVVEDDPLVAKEIAAALEDFGFGVECAATGGEGLSRARLGAFDVIVLDRMLPDIDGLSVLSTLYNIGIETPILILSALAGVDDRIRGLRAGGDDYLIKPFDTLELNARLMALLRHRTAAALPSLLQYADISVDTALNQAFRAGQPLELKPREYKLLEYMVMRAGQVVTRAMLFEAVWNYHFNAQSNVIDMHIGQLRRKVSLNGKASGMIHTVRNVGYILQSSD